MAFLVFGLFGADLKCINRFLVTASVEETNKKSKLVIQVREFDNNHDIKVAKSASGSLDGVVSFSEANRIADELGAIGCSAEPKEVEILKSLEF